VLTLQLPSMFYGGKPLETAGHRRLGERRPPSWPPFLPAAAGRGRPSRCGCRDCRRVSDFLQRRQVLSGSRRRSSGVLSGGEQNLAFFGSCSRTCWEWKSNWESLRLILSVSAF
jgi:hypothetical protein